MTCIIRVLLLFRVLKQNFIGESIFHFQVILGPWKQNTLQNVLSVLVKVDFDAFINKSKWCFATWKISHLSVTDFGFYRLSKFADELRGPFNRNRLLCWFSVDREILDFFFCRWSWTDCFIWAMSFWSLAVLLVTVRFWKIFNF